MSNLQSRDVTGEAYVHLQTVYHKICHCVGREVLLVCAALLLLLTDNAKASASAPTHPGQETLSTVSIPGSLPESGVTAGYEPPGARNIEPRVRKAPFTDYSGSSSVPVAEAEAVAPPLHTAVEEDRTPDWNGIWRDTGLLIGSQFGAAGLIFLMPESVSNWSSEQKKDSFKKYSANVVNPVFDKDKFYINYALHPYWGATYYIRGRERGLDKASSFVYSTLMSAVYEFGVECFFEKPSIQDLIVTPVAGSLLGALIFEPLRDAIKHKQDPSWYDHAALVLTDPLGVLSLGFEKLFGIQSTIMVDYSGPQLQRRSAGSSVESKNSRIGVAMNFSMD